MAQDPAPTPANGSNPVPSGVPQPQWEPPKGDQEFVFESVDKAPAWVDKSWAGFDRGPALQVPAGNLDGTGPYHTSTARVGDTVKFIAAKGSTPGHLVVIPGEPDPKEKGQATRKPPQVSNASLEDLLRTGAISPDDLGADAKAQVAGRTPGLQKVVEGEQKIAEPQKISDIVKTD